MYEMNTATINDLNLSQSAVTAASRVGPPSSALSPSSSRAFFATGTAAEDGDDESNAVAPSLCGMIAFWHFLKGKASNKEVSTQHTHSIYPSRSSQLADLPFLLYRVRPAACWCMNEVSKWDLSCVLVRNTDFSRTCGARTIPRTPPRTSTRSSHKLAARDWHLHSRHFYSNCYLKREFLQGFYQKPRTSHGRSPQVLDLTIRYLSPLFPLIPLPLISLFHSLLCIG